MNKRIGRFAMSTQLVERDPETARAIMGRCIVVRCEMMYAYNTLEYMALSPDFDEVHQGDIVPEYNVIISESGKRIEFKRTNKPLHNGVSALNNELGFEKWAKENSDFDLERLAGDSGYVRHETQYAWQIWRDAVNWRELWR